jgi:hypothetical protein
MKEDLIERMIEVEAMNKNIWKRFDLVFLAVAVAFSLCSCYYSDVDGRDGYHDYSLGAIELRNYSDATIDRFYLPSIDQPLWGPNILADFIYPDDYMQITDIDPGNYDAMITVRDPYSDYFAYVYDIHIEPGLIYTLDVDNYSFTGSLEIHNNTSGTDIIGLYVVSVSNPTWGDNQASSDIRPSCTIHLNDFDPGRYDVRVIWNAGPETVYNDISIDSLVLTTLDVD